MAGDKISMACSARTKIPKTRDQSHTIELQAKATGEEAIAIIEAEEETSVMSTADTTVEIEVMIHSILVEPKNYFLELKPHLMA